MTDKNIFPELQLNTLLTKNPTFPEHNEQPSDLKLLKMRGNLPPPNTFKSVMTKKGYSRQLFKKSRPQQQDRKEVQENWFAKSRSA